MVYALRPSQPECLYLFGSWARGNADALRDLNIVIQFGHHLNLLVQAITRTECMRYVGAKAHV